MKGKRLFVCFPPFQIDNVQGLIQCPGVLVCVGREPSHPSIVENFQKSIKLPKLNLRTRSDVCNEEQEGRSHGSPTQVPIFKLIAILMDLLVWFFFSFLHLHGKRRAARERCHQS